MLALVPTVPFTLNAGSLPVLVVLILVAIWLIRRVLKALLILGIVALLVMSLISVRSQLEYVADTSVFLDHPTGGAACRTHIDRAFLRNPSVTLLIPTPTVFLEARRRRGLVRLRPTPLGATIRPVMETWREHLQPDAIIVATARHYRVPLLTADHPTPERRRLWWGIRVIRACSG